MANKLGIAFVRIADNVGGAYRHYQARFGATDFTFDAAGSDQVFEVDAGASFSVRLKWGVSGTPTFGVQNAISVNLFYENKDLATAGTGSAIRSQNAATPGNASGDETFTFWATSDGTSTGTPVSGIYRIRVIASRGDAVTWGPCDSDGNDTTPPAATTRTRDTMVLRFGMDFLSLVMRDQVPTDRAGDGVASPTTFAYPDSIEARLTIKGGPKDTTTNTNCKLQFDSADGGAGMTGTTGVIPVGSASQIITQRIGEAGAGDGGADTRFPSASTSAKLKVTVVGNAALVPASGNILWTHIANVTAGGTWTGTPDTAPNSVENKASEKTGAFTVDPRLTRVAVSAPAMPRMRNEASTFTLRVTNARSENIAQHGNASSAAKKQIDFAYKDGSTTEQSVLDVSPNGSHEYSPAVTWDGDDLAAWDLTGRQKDEVLTAQVFGANNPSVTTANIAQLSRRFLMSKTDLGASVSPGSITEGVKTGKTAGADDATVRNRGQTLFFECYIYNARGDRLATPTLNYNVRPSGSETYEDAVQSVALVAGKFSGSYAVDTDEATGTKALVIASGSASGSQETRTGNGGTGNFAESSTGSPEWTVSATYTLVCRNQGSNAAAGQLGAKRTTTPTEEDEGDHDFTIGNDAIYGFARVKDASGDPVGGASVLFEQVDVNGAVRQNATVASSVAAGYGGWTSKADGTTDALGVAFDTRTPSGLKTDPSPWKQRVTVTGHNGNDGTDQCLISMLSAYTANKNIIPSVGPFPGVANTLGHPTAVDGTHPKPGDLLLSGLAMLVDGVRVLPEATPELLVARFNTTTRKAEVLQSDGTFQAKTLANGDPNPAYFEDGDGRPYYFPFKFIVESLEWLSFFGTAAQIQAASGVPPGSEGTVGYVMNTGTWPAGKLYIVVKLTHGAQVFYDDEWEVFIAGTAQHPYSDDTLPERKVLWDTATGHNHDGVNSRKSKRVFDGAGFVTGFGKM